MIYKGHLSLKIIFYSWAPVDPPYSKAPFRRRAESILQKEKNIIFSDKYWLQKTVFSCIIFVKLLLLFVKLLL